MVNIPDECTASWGEPKHCMCNLQCLGSPHNALHLSSIFTMHCQQSAASDCCTIHDVYNSWLLRAKSFQQSDTLQKIYIPGSLYCDHQAPVMPAQEHTVHPIWIPGSFCCEHQRPLCRRKSTLNPIAYVS